LFEPVEIGTRCLADGGLVAPVPTRAARELGATTVIGISVGMQDGYRGAPTNIFQVVSRAVSGRAKNIINSKFWNATPTLFFARRAVLAWTISTAPKKRSKPALPLRAGRSRASRTLDRRTPRRSSAKPVSSRRSGYLWLRRPFDDTSQRMSSQYSPCCFLAMA